jgi:hypothetical protein
MAFGPSLIDQCCSLFHVKQVKNTPECFCEEREIAFCSAPVNADEEQGAYVENQEQCGAAPLAS